MMRMSPDWLESAPVLCWNAVAEPVEHCLACCLAGGLRGRASAAAAPRAATERRSDVRHAECSRAAGGPVLIVVNPPFAFGKIVVAPVGAQPETPANKFVSTGASWTALACLSR